MRTAKNASLQPRPYLEQFGLLPPSQSGLIVHNSSKTVLFLISCIYSALDKSQLALFALYDVSAAIEMAFYWKDSGSRYFLGHARQHSCLAPFLS